MDATQQLLQLERDRFAADTDIRYLQLTVALVLLILLAYYITRGFPLARGVQQPGPGFNVADASTSAPAPSFKSERLAVPNFSAANAEVLREDFAPYASILAADVQRSDAASDRAPRTAQPQRYNQRSSENMLFNQINALSIAMPINY